MGSIHPSLQKKIDKTTINKYYCECSCVLVIQHSCIGMRIHTTVDSRRLTQLLNTLVTASVCNIAVCGAICGWP